MIRMGARYVQDGSLTQEGYQTFAALERRLAALEARLAAASAVPAAVGGATVDAEARAELVAIKAALS